MNTEIRMLLMDVFKQNGYSIADENDSAQLELDSLQFISILCDVENEFGISIPDEYMTGENLSTFCDFVKLVTELAKENTDNE